MRVVPIPSDVPGERRVLGPPEGMSGQDCDTIDILVERVELPSGVECDAVSALVFVSADELRRIEAAGGHFWVRFLGSTFPPVCFAAPDEQAEVTG